jgi:hypothetical protein
MRMGELLISDAVGVHRFMVTRGATHLDSPQHRLVHALLTHADGPFKELADSLFSPPLGPALVGLTARIVSLNLGDARRRLFRARREAGREGIRDGDMGEREGRLLQPRPAGVISRGWDGPRRRLPCEGRPLARRWRFGRWGGRDGHRERQASGDARESTEGLAEEGAGALPALLNDRADCALPG